MLRDGMAADSGREQESSLLPWHLNLPAVLEASEACVMCKLILQGLREGREQLVEKTRNSGDWFETPKDFDDDILTIPYYSNAKPKLSIVARSVDEFETKNSMTSDKNLEGALKAHILIRVACSGGIAVKSSWDGYERIGCELRVSSIDGN